MSQWPRAFADHNSSLICAKSRCTCDQQFVKAVQLGQCLSYHYNIKQIRHCGVSKYKRVVVTEAYVLYVYKSYWAGHNQGVKMLPLLAKFHEVIATDYNFLVHSLHYPSYSFSPLQTMSVKQCRCKVSLLHSNKSNLLSILWIKYI